MKTINSFRSKFFALTLALMASVSSFAYNFGSGGLFFNIIDYDNCQAEVTYQKERSEENYSNLTHVIIPDTVLRGRVKYAVVSIGNMAFHKCQTLESIVIPDHITNIGTNVFDGCTALTSVQLPRTITYLNSSLFSNCKSLRTFTIPDNITSIYGSVFQSCHSLSEVNIPSSVTSIGKYAFRYCNSLKSITIPNSVKTIDRGAFYQCKALTDVQLPDSLTTITQEMFFECTALESITIPAGVTHIEKDAFDWCSKLKTMTLHNKIEYIDEWAFSQTEISTFVLAMKNAEEACNNRVNKILHNIGQQYATRKITIAGEKVRDLVVPNIVDSISDYAFAYSYIASVDIPNNLKRINPTAFYKCPSLQSVCWNALDFEEVSSAANAPFNKVASQIHTFKFGRDIKHIPAYLCYDMNRLDSIEIPAGVKSIGKHAFAHCSPSVVICHASQVPNIDESAFSKDYVSNTILYVPAESVEAYKNSEQWNKFAHIVAIGDKIEETDSNWDWTLVHDFAVDNFGYSILENATTPSVQIIEAVGKSGHVDIPTEVMHNDTLYKVTGLGTGIVTTFRYSPNLTSVFIPKEILLVNNAVFADCPNLESIVVEEGNVYQDSRDNCNAVIRNLYSDRSPELVIGCKNTTIPNGVLSIGSYAFRGCKGLQEIEIPSSVTTIYRSAFYGCISLKSVVLGENITSIEDLAFYNCYNLEKIVSLSLTPPSKGASAFNSTPITDPDIEERAPIYVPDASVEVYKQAWKDYNIQPLSSMPVSEDLFPTLWGLQRTSCDEWLEGCGENKSYLFAPKEVKEINGKLYLKCGGVFLREEDNKVLIYSFPYEKDLVLYDWTLEIGDTLQNLGIDPYSFPELEYAAVVDYIAYEDYDVETGDFIIKKEPLGNKRVKDISTIRLLDGNEYKAWLFGYDWERGDYYIEGIGNANKYGGDYVDLAHPFPVPTCYYGERLVCVSRDGILLYQMDDTEMERLGAECLCEYNDGPKKDNAKDGKIGGRPTPTQWNMLEMVVREMENNKTILQAETFSYTLEDNSRILNNKTYFDLARQSTRDTAITKSVVGALHFSEDEGNRVYFLCDGMEYLLYDFTAELGDSIEIFAGINNYPQATTYTHVVTGKDTLENGACRMVLEVVFPNQTGGTNLQKVWLAGLGSLDGIVHNSAQLASNARSAETESSVMLCAWREDDCLYTTDHPEFGNVGCVYNLPTAVDDIQTPENQYQKIIHNGHLYILRNNKIYDVLGTPLTNH